MGTGTFSVEDHPRQHSRHWNVVDADIFTFVLNQEIHKATRLRYCFSLLCLSPDVPDRDVDPTLTRSVAEQAIRQLRAQDLATCFPASCVALLLIDAEARHLPAILQRLSRAFATAPLPVGGQARCVTVSSGAGTYPQTATGVAELFKQAVDLMTRAKKEGGDRIYLPS